RPTGPRGLLLTPTAHASHRPGRGGGNCRHASEHRAHVRPARQPIHARTLPVACDFASEVLLCAGGGDGDTRFLDNVISANTAFLDKGKAPSVRKGKIYAKKNLSKIINIALTGQYVDHYQEKL